MLAALKKSQLLQNNDLLMFRSKFAGDEEAFDAPKALHKMNKVSMGKFFLEKARTIQVLAKKNSTSRPRKRRG
ncbi:hypothetical protein MUK42_19442 [Musa troglodytarum]|uniref:Uncharacterized protein n=1 Tax=Musa troglodytarum TaxID=320322 RepID=A0A9E7G4C7_9LILI|nr:hypothetical protein MUK42_19442 [Musa troglodytarum]